MASTDRIETVTRLAAPLATSLGLEIWGVEIAGATRPLVRIYVELLAAPHRTPSPNQTSALDAAPEKLPENVSSSEDFLMEDLPDGPKTAAGVSIDQCAHLSRLLGLALEVEDIFATGWTLEVSSPGLERPFFQVDQMQGYMGREIEATLGAPLENWPGRKKFCGILSRVADGTFTLDLPLTPVARRKVDEPESVVIAWPFVRKATLIHTFPERGVKKGGSGGLSGGAA